MRGSHPSRSRRADEDVGAEPAPLPSSRGSRATGYGNTTRRADVQERPGGRVSAESPSLLDSGIEEIVVPPEFSWMTPGEYKSAISAQQQFENRSSKHQDEEEGMWEREVLAADGRGKVSMKTDSPHRMRSDSPLSPQVIPWRDSHEENMRARDAVEREKTSSAKQKNKKLHQNNKRGKFSPGVLEDDYLSPPSMQSRATYADGTIGSTNDYRRGLVDREVSSADVSSSTPVGAVSVPGIASAAATLDPEQGEMRTLHDDDGRPGTVVANAVTRDDLADELRMQMRSEIRQELQAQMQQTAVHAEAVSTAAETQSHQTRTTSESEASNKLPFWKRRWIILVVLIILVAALAGLLGFFLSSGGDNNGGDRTVTGGEGAATGSPSTSSPTPNVVNSEPPTPTPTTGETPSPTTPSPTPPPTEPPTTAPPVTQSPTPPSTELAEVVSLSFMQRLEGRNEAGDRFGGHVVLSRDGTTMAVGAQSGQYVRVYRRSGSAWDRLGQSIEGKGEFGARLDLSRNGNVLVVGAWNNDDAAENSGQARVFEYTSGSWKQRGQNLNGFEKEDKFGWAVALSDDGMTMAASGRLGDPSGDKIDAGYVIVFSYVDSKWEVLGEVIEGKNADAEFGRSISLDSSGRRIAIGENKFGPGRVKVFDLVGARWNSVGQPLDGEAIEDWQGTAVALSANGDTVAVAADGNDRNGNNAGMVRVYRLSGCCTWEQVGQNILGEVEGDQLGAGHISLSDDGNLLAVGALHSNSDRGKAYLYQFINPSGWTKAGEVTGDSSGDKFGDTVSVSGDGSYFAVGAPNANDIRGYVRVYFVG